MPVERPANAVSPRANHTVSAGQSTGRRLPEERVDASPRRPARSPGGEDPGGRGADQRGLNTLS